MEYTSVEIVRLSNKFFGDEWFEPLLVKHRGNIPFEVLLEHMKTVQQQIRDMLAQRDVNEEACKKDCPTFCRTRHCMYCKELVRDECDEE